ncbi:hypothetical protein EDB30_102331 [Vibrio crassostreae]|nr:hypothetical protein EDB30_102331 [Vibrio crassostreae]
MLDFELRLAITFSISYTKLGESQFIIVENIDISPLLKGFTGIDTSYGKNTSVCSSQKREALLPFLNAQIIPRSFAHSMNSL